VKTHVYYGGGLDPIIKQCDADFSWEYGLSILKSFAHTKNLKRPDFIDKYFYDSGAFSAWASGKEIKLEDYIAFMKEHKDEVDVYANLDVIGCAEGTVKNYLAMREADLDPLPVFHFGEPESVLDLYMEHTDYIGLGGLVGINKENRYYFLDRVFNKCPDPAKTYFHGFGIFMFDLVKEYPWGTIDSTTPVIMAANGNIYSPWGGLLISDSLQNNITSVKSDDELKKIREWAEACGVNYDTMCLGTMEGTVERAKSNYLFFSRFIESLGDRGVFKPKDFKPTFF